MSKGKSILNNVKLEHWIECWKTNKLIWQMDEAHPFLSKISESFKPKSNVFIPLCGKTLDMIHLADHGHSVVGVEFMKKGIEDFFGENAIKFNKITSTKNKDLTLYEAVEKDIKIYNGNIFNIKPQHLAGSDRYDVIWDRGSFVAMHPDDRPKYTAVMKALSKSTEADLDYFMEAFMLDMSSHGGPPFDSPREIVDANWGDVFDVKSLYEADAPMFADRLEIDQLTVCYYLLKLKQQQNTTAEK